MGDQTANRDLSGEDLRAFMKRVLTDLRALEQMIASGMIETGVRRVGAEQEMFLVDGAMRPAMRALDVLREVNDPRFTTEIGLFNLEANLDPCLFGGDCLSRLEAQLDDVLGAARRAAAACETDVVLTGILPTIRKSDLGLDAMTPIPRYFALNRAMSRMRGGAYEFRIKGVDELIVNHDSVMVEACNASFQVHFQVGAEEFANLYNIAQFITGPILAVAANSPLLFGRRLWRETRIAVFRQSVDTRSTHQHLRERSPRVTFGRNWVRHSVIELFQEDISRFRALLGVEDDEDPFATLEQGDTPRLKSLRLHNGTVYRWNRACYGLTDGKPHLRIENRVLPAGPTPHDEVANAALWFGMISALAMGHEDIAAEVEFDVAKGNFFAAAQHGLAAQFTWFDGKVYPARELLLDRLVPDARRGLAAAGIDPADIDRYLGTIERRVKAGVTGAGWLLRSLGSMKEKGTAGERLNALTAATLARQKTGRPVAEWEPARLEEAGGWKFNYMRVEQFMVTDLFTVQEDELIDLVANLMEWERIRHVPVEDNQHRLVGLVSYRNLLRVLAQGRGGGDRSTIAVSEVMKKDPVTVAPEASTLEAIALMRRHKIGCLPVVKDDRLVGLVTDHEFMDIAAELLEQKLRE
ncbi:MAG: CBS domain-containing protein [Acidobacteriota bacterium]|nr:CBS domain-containing protein [Acidobacteriota bacterium]